MISICIPVYNYNVVELVQELSNQLQYSKITGEIIVYDDFSDAYIREDNKDIRNTPNVFYKELDENVGRIKMRIMLANATRYPWLLFIDSDSAIIDKSYLSKYLQQIMAGHKVCTGGRIYSPIPPMKCTQRLHWKYGSRREALKGSTTSFHTNNFCIEKEIFQQLQFPEYINGYGHEDTWMKLELERKKIKIKYLDNPVLHQCIIDTEEFLSKTLEALSNLILLAKNTDTAMLRKNVALYNAFHLLYGAKLDLAFSFAYKKMKERVLKNLNSCHPFLKFYDAYKLNAFIEMARQKHLEKQIHKS